MESSDNSHRASPPDAPRHGPHYGFTGSPTAFLAPAWSLSLEWQFYLVAPFLFAFLGSGRRFAIEILCGLTLLTFVLSRKFWHVEYGAFLPMHLDFFFLGSLSYLLFRQAAKRKWPPLFPIGLLGSIFLFVYSDHHLEIVPICLWIPFFCLFTDHATGSNPPYRRWISWLFDNQLVQYFGKISFSIYLSHVLVIIVTQWLLFRFHPEISHAAHFGFLLVLTVFGTLAVSHFCFHLIERPGIRWGKAVIANLEHRRD